MKLRPSIHQLLQGMSLSLSIIVGLTACAPAATSPVAPGAASVATPASAPTPGLTTSNPTPSVRVPSPAQAGSATPTPASAPSAPRPVASPAVSGETPRRGGILLSSMHADVSTFNPLQTGNGFDYWAIRPVYSQLVKLDFTDPTRSKVIPDLATSWSWGSDGKSLTFKLRPNVKWHDGVPFTSADVKFTFDNWYAPPKGVASPRKGLFWAVRTVDTPDAQTVTVGLKDVDPSFIASLAWGWNMVQPKHIADKGEDFARVVVGTGPFVFKRFEPGVVVEYARNDNYYEPGLPYLGGVKTYIVRDVNTMLAALYSKRIHWSSPAFCCSLTADQIDAARKTRPDLQAMDAPTTILGYLILNTTTPPFDNVKVRQAISEAIDRQTLASTGPHRPGLVSGPMLQSGAWALPENELRKLPGYGPDMKIRRARAVQLLKEAGYPNGLSAKLLVRTAKDFVDVGLGIQQQLAQVGIKVELEPRETVETRSRETQTRYEMSSAGWGVTDDPTVTFGNHWVSGAERNWSRYKNPRIDDLFNEQAKTLDGVKRKQFSNDISRMAITDAANIVLYYWSGYHIRWPFVHFRGFSGESGDVNDSNYSLETVWLSQ